MAVTLYDTFDISIFDIFSGKSLSLTGGLVQVCVAGTYHKATLYDPDNGYVALANPVTPTRGKIRFAIVESGAPPSCDIYGMTAKGHFFVKTGCLPGDPSEVPINANLRYETAVIPFAIADCTAGTEKDTSFVLPSGSIVRPWPAVGVVTAAGQGSKTITAGLLSTQSGGSAAGFINGPSLTTIAVITTKQASTGTLGSLLIETTTGAAAVIPVPYVVGATAVNISYTLTSGATLAEGYFTLDYILPLA